MRIWDGVLGFFCSEPGPFKGAWQVKRGVGGEDGEVGKKNTDQVGPTSPNANVEDQILNVISRRAVGNYPEVMHKAQDSWPPWGVFIFQESDHSFCPWFMTFPEYIDPVKVYQQMTAIYTIMMKKHLRAFARFIIF